MYLKEEIVSAVARGVKHIPKFTGEIHRPHVGWEVGDIFTIPDKFEVYQEYFGSMCSQFIFVELQNGKVKKLYPSVFTKCVREYTKEGEPTNHHVRVTGEVVNLFNKFANIQEGMEALAGHIICVSDVKIVRTNVFGTNVIRCAQIPTFDFLA